MQERGDEELVSEAQRGASPAFTTLVERYFDRVYRYTAMRIGNTADAEDLAQEVFLKAWKAIGKYRWTGAPFSAWLFRIAHNLVVDQYRRQGQGATVSLEDMPQDPSRDDVEEQAELALSVDELRKALPKLTEAQRQVILLRFGSGLSLEETAAAMKKKVNAVKALQHAAVLSLRRILVKVSVAEKP
ncbi:MAG: sigma-70 family RNA polymerase sigma factor [Chloroflexi bacterium]|nr:sigma-70 family RNA polymerase sigma factor [Chloroflexota bacterium]